MQWLWLSAELSCPVPFVLTCWAYSDRDVAERSVLIKNMLEDLGDSGEAIPIPNVRLPPSML